MCSLGSATSAGAKGRVAKPKTKPPSSGISGRGTVVEVLTKEARSAAIEMIRERHYTRTVPSGKSHYIRFKDAIVVWSLPANKNIAKFLLNWQGNVWELSRLWAPNGHEPNLLTQAISAAVKELQRLETPDALVSYADPNAGHKGGVYRAASWIYTGASSEARAYRGPNGEIVARRAFHSGKKCLTKKEIEARGYCQLNLPGKHRFVRVLTRRGWSRFALDLV